jgi:hypothetical protein
MAGDLLLLMVKEKITFREMRDMGVRGLLVYCSDYHCSHLGRDQRRSMAG